MLPTNDFDILVSVSNQLKNSYMRGYDDPWVSSPFAWIKTRPSRQVGKIGEQLIAAWCQQRGITVSRSGDSEADMVFNGKRIEVKFSTLWGSRVYTFQQIRDQNYEYAVFLGISPNEAHCWFVTKTLLRQYVIGHVPQHAGKAGSDTFWLTFQVDNPPDWLRPFGGTLSQAFDVMTKNL